MFTNKKRMLIPVFSIVLVTLMALISVVPALAAARAKEPVLSPAETAPIGPDPKLEPIIPVPPTGFLYVAKLGYEDLPWFDATNRRMAIHVVIADSGGRPEAGAQVIGRLDIGAADIAPFIGLTDSNGEVIFTTLIPRDAEGKFCVEDVSKKGFEYVPGKNFRTCFEITPR